MKKYNYATLLVIAVILFKSCGNAEENYWSQFRGTNASGIATPDSKPPIEFGEEQNLLWKTVIPEGTSSPCMWKKNLYLTAFEEDSMELKILCINRSKGEIVWSKSISPGKFENPHPVSNPAQATIAADNEGIYVYFASEGLRKYDHDGNLIWRYDLPIPENVRYGHPSSPVIMDDKVILNLDYGNNEERSILALNKNTGKEEWRTMTQMLTPFNVHGSPGYSTAVRYGDQLIVHRSGGVASYLLSDGSPVWWIQFITNGIGTPVIKDDIVYVNAWMEFSEKERRGNFFDYDNFGKVLHDFDQDGNLFIEDEEIPGDLMIMNRPGADDIENTQISVKMMFNAFDKDRNGMINKEEWEQFYRRMSAFVMDLGLVAIPAGLKGELSANDILWMQMEKISEVPSPIVYDNYVFMIKDGGWLSIMDAKTGEVYFQEQIGASGPYIASPVVANGEIYLSSYNGIISVMEAGKVPVLVSENKLEGKILATPAISGKSLYVRTSKYLYAFRK